MSKGNGKNNGGNGAKETLEIELNTRQRKFVKLILNTEDKRTIGEKGVAVGYSENYGYVLHAEPHIQAAIDKVLTHEEMELKIHRVRVKKVLAERATQERVVIDPKTGKALYLDAGDANKAAEIFLKSQGDIPTGSNIHLTQSVTNEAETRESRKGRLSEHFTDRELITK